MRERKRLVVFASGRGSNAEAIHAAVGRGEIHGDIVLIVSDKEGAAVLALAEGWGIPAFVSHPRDFESKDAFERDLIRRIEPYRPDGIILAGYMRLFGATFIDAYEHKILNIHPALLPSFPGLHAQRQAVEAGVKVSGCTVHFVDTGTDTGPVVLQRVVPVFESDDEAKLAARILPEEHEAYPEAVRLFCMDALRIENGKVYIDEPEDDGGKADSHD